MDADKRLILFSFNEEEYTTHGSRSMLSFSDKDESILFSTSGDRPKNYKFCNIHSKKEKITLPDSQQISAVHALKKNVTSIKVTGKRDCVCVESETCPLHHNNEKARAYCYILHIAP